MGKDPVGPISPSIYENQVGMNQRSKCRGESKKPYKAESTGELSRARPYRTASLTWLKFQMQQKKMFINLGENNHNDP